MPTTAEALQALGAWIVKPIQPSDVQLGVPISYRVNYLWNNKAARLSFTTNFERVQSTPIPQITEWTISFGTADDDKDDDTVLSVTVSGPNGNLADRRDADGRFPNGSTKTWKLPLVSKIYARDVGSIHLGIHIDPNGDDEWDFGWTLTGRSDDGRVVYHRDGHCRLTESRRDCGF